MKPLKNLLVLDMSQFLAGPAAALRLADMGARVIKIERPEVGDLCRQLYISNLELDGDSTLFHSINRNKQSVTANLKDRDDLAKVKQLIERADVLIENFRPGVMQRLGLGYDAVSKINPRIVYGRVTGYGDEGPWQNLPGQDLLAQARSGLLWLTGNHDAEPTAMGIAVADMFAGACLVQGLLACLVRRGVTGKGGLVETSLMEAVLDFQFEVLTTHLNDGGKLPARSATNNGHAYLSAPYGVYQTADGYLALAMNLLTKLGPLLELEVLADPHFANQTFERRDEIKAMLSDQIKTRTTQAWLDVLIPEDVWCADVLTWRDLLSHDAFKVLKMTQQITRTDGPSMQTLRCPIRIDGQILSNERGAPRLGENNEMITRELNQT